MRKEKEKMKMNIKKTLSAVMLTAALITGNLAIPAYAAPKDVEVNTCTCACCHIHLNNASDRHICGYYRSTVYGDWQTGWWNLDKPISVRYRTRKVSIVCQTCGKELSSYTQRQRQEATYWGLLKLTDWYNV